MAVKTKTKKLQAKSKTAVQTKSKEMSQAESKQKTDSRQGLDATTKVRVVNKISPPRMVSNGDDRKSIKGARVLPQYAYMKAPGMMHDFQVGDTVEVFCDHEKNRDRVRGWIRGIVVQVDNKMVAVQFRSNVFLTDGWMVPDRILWYPLNSEHIRPVIKKSGKREKAIPDY
jgi:nicotinate-nucleotide pyrophosphorylase